LTSRGLSTSSPSYQQPLETSDENEESLRLAACQMPTMLDIGARNIFTSDHDMFREHTRRWMREKLAPLQNSFEENGQPSREIWTEMGEQGLLGVSIPAEDGGHGYSFLDEAIVAEEMSYANCASPAMAVHSTICMPYLVHYGTKEQKERYLAAMTGGVRGQCGNDGA